MKDRAPIIDSIDKRDFHNDLKKTVVKRSRVHFVTVEEEEAQRQAEMQASMDNSNDLNAPMEENVSNIPEGVEIVDPTLDVSGIDPDVLAQADEIFRRLQREAEEDDMAKKREWEEKIMADSNRDPNYNASTGSYSGTYGQGEVSDETRAQADAILNMKKSELQSIIDENSGEN